MVTISRALLLNKHLDMFELLMKGSLPSRYRDE